MYGTNLREYSHRDGNMDFMLTVVAHTNSSVAVSGAVIIVVS